MSLPSDPPPSIPAADGSPSKNRSAQWVLHPIVEREIAEEARARRKRGQNGWLIASALVVTCPFCCSSPALAMGEGGAASVAGAIALLALVVGTGFLFLRSACLNSTLSGADRALKAEFSHASGWIVDLIVLQGDAPTGYDRGLLWFEDDRLLFAGRRTSFALARSQVVAPLNEASPVPDLRPNWKLRLDRRTAPGPIAVGFSQTPKAKLEGVSADDLGRALRGWMGSKASGDGQYPPLDLGPDAPSSGRLLGSALVATVRVVLVSTAILALTGITAGATIAVAAFAGTLFFAGGGSAVFALRWRAWRDRCILDRRLVNPADPSKAQ